MNERLVLTEGGPAGESLCLPDEAAARLLAETKLVTVLPSRHGWWVTPVPKMVGVVRVGDVQVELRPKDSVKLSSLLFLLGYARDPGFRPEYVDGIDDDDLWSAMAIALVRSVTSALARGVLQGYRTVEDSLPVVRGRIDLATQLATRPGVMVPIAVRYDDYLVDTPENRILRTALRRMAAVPRVPSAVRGQLLALDARLDGVGLLHPRDPIPAWRPSRLNTRYQPALRLAEVILRSTSVTPGGVTGHRVAAFVVQMWQVFEDFVTTALTEALRPCPGSLSPQLKTYLAGGGDWRDGEIAMYPDLVHRGPDGRPLAVIDAKYKRASADGIPNADLYQMLAYCTALNVPTAWLLYAAGCDTPKLHRIKHCDVIVVEHPLNVALSPSEILRQIDGVAVALLDARAPSMAGQP